MSDVGGQVTNQPLSLVIGQRLPDVLGYYILKQQSFHQTDPATLIPDTNNNGPYHAYFGVVQSALGVVSTASVTLPTSAVKPLPGPYAGLDLQAHEPFANLPQFEAAYPPGRYTFSLMTLHEGAQFPGLNLPAPVYPAAPRISNFSAAQAVNPRQGFTLQWDAFAGGTTNDSIWLVILDGNGVGVFATPRPSVDPAGSLKGTGASTVVPANALGLNQSYTGLLLFNKTVSTDTSSYPGASGFVLFGAQTSFPLNTISGRPAISQPARTSNREFLFRVSGMAGQKYTIQWSATLADWTTLYVTNPPSAVFTVVDPDASESGRFYRVQVGP